MTMPSPDDKQKAKQHSHRVSASDDIEVSTYLEIAKGLQVEQTVPETKPLSLAKRETIIVFDFGSQYTMLIARRIRECHVYCEVVPYNVSLENIASLEPRGFILSGGPSSVYAPGAPLTSEYIYEQHIPVMGICYGMQVITHQLGGRVLPGERNEYGQSMLDISDTTNPLFKGLPSTLPVWMSHADHVIDMPPNFKALAHTENSPVAVMGNSEHIYGLQFHPEVAHTPHGKEIFENFVHRICGCKGNWTPARFKTESVAKIKKQVGDEKVICALSGGVDSAVTATLIHLAIGDNLTCFFINNGLLRREEAERILNTFKRNLKLNIVYIDASERFLQQLRGVTDPETKRKMIGVEFIKVFEEEATKLGKIAFLAQGTLYPDVIESTSVETKAAVTIKSHHNVGGLPSDMKLRLVEPLRYLFKDEVRELGLTLGMPEDLLWRQPFPGPGLAIRIIGEVTKEKLEILRGADWIVMDEIKKANLYRQLWQTFAVLTDVKSVGVMGDYRTYGYLIAVRAVKSNDAMITEHMAI
jgi:GMP synthase (glutamine-hydrolysing)